MENQNNNQADNQSQYNQDRISAINNYINQYKEQYPMDSIRRNLSIIASMGWVQLF